MTTGVGVGVGERFKTVGGSSSSPSGEARKKQPKKTTTPTRGTYIPDDFTVTEDMSDWARRKHPLAYKDLDYHTEQFIAYWQGRSGQIAIKRNWKATWESWIRKQNHEAAEKANRFGDQSKRRVEPTAERCDRHPRELAGYCTICDAEMRGAA